MHSTANSTGLERVQIEPIGGGYAQVWLRANISEGVDEDGNPIFCADEASGIVDEVPTVDAIEADFEGWWQRLEDAGKTDAERIADLTGRLADAETRAELLEAAVVELAELYGGEL